jgi:acyl-CoA reductase-like NAD-dependent aldehyde dehydrogenase
MTSPPSIALRMTWIHASIQFSTSSLHIVAHRVAAAVRAGMFWVNGYRTIHVSVPFGGFRASGRSAATEVNFPRWILARQLRFGLHRRADAQGCPSRP